jgi:hypothetical protein
MNVSAKEQDKKQEINPFPARISGNGSGNNEVHDEEQ